MRWIAADLATGDGKSAALDVASLSARAIAGVKDPAFRGAYRTLWEEFGPGGGMETEDVITARLRWGREPRADGWTLFYQLLIVQDGEGWAAVRDHSVIIPPAGVGNFPLATTVHLSHLLVAPHWRRTGLAGWLRAMPLQAARDCLRQRTCSDGETRVTFIAEMDPVLPGQPGRAGRLRAYGKAGFRWVDPSAVRYFQPDFRTPLAIDAAGGPRPLPMELLVRRVGREGEEHADGSELRDLVDALYRLYAEGCRARDIEPLREQVRTRYPAPDESVSLRLPSAVLDG